jgi:hypothetical protein
MSSSSSTIYTINRKCNNDIENSSSYSKFIFFGCWNNINCDSEYIYRDIVLDYIKRVELNIYQLYIAGDNWYTNKKKIDEKEYKLYITDILRTGYDKLYKMNKEIYIAVGNHDVDSNITNDTTNSNAAKLKKNCNINTQKYYLNKIKEQAITIPTLEYLNDIEKTELNEETLCEKGVYIYIDNIGVRYNKNNIIIIINTNILDDLEIDNGLKYLKKIKSVIKQVVKVLIDNSSNKQIFVMGHIPLFTYKNDKISIYEINKKDHKYRIIIDKLFDILVTNNIIYLCADTHNFSIMEINKGINTLIQITAGTGGADPDLINGNYDTQPNNVILNLEIKSNQINTYNIKAYALNSYGYVSINIEGQNIDVCYTQVLTDKQDTYNKSKNPYNSLFLVNKPKKLYNKLSLPTPKKIIKLSKINKLTYRITIANGIATVNYLSKNTSISAFANNIKYKDKSICNKIMTNPNGFIKNREGNLFCYNKEVKKDKK